ncbi:hypothetical protein OH76DRAFT_1410538 [Lentinus brumalis]|uniref:F-box domain-containing protein n=1 Tax=Lentinus brumalis TaxID=2498619 RepID=A0A371CRU1_9APHY|nr:hypothetical protein OH76DRAFT_1410538 [Polyporus brumalis]
MLSLMRQGGWQSQAATPVKSSFADLPVELTRRIFKEILPPHYQYDPSITEGSNNPWLRALRLKKTLPLLCKAIYWPGMEILYEDIVIRRMGQISALAQTLRSDDLGQKLASMVKTIRIESCPVWLPCADVLREDLAFIISQCTTLTRFSYRPHDNFPTVGPFEEHDVQYYGWFNPTWLYQQSFEPEVEPLLTRCFASGLRFLSLGVSLDCTTVRCLHHILSSAEKLESLTLGPTKGCSACHSLIGMPQLQLPRLKELQLYYGTASESDIDSHIRSCRQMPLLTRLTIMLREWAAVSTLIETAGHGLTYLHLYPLADALRKSQCNSINTLATACPKIEHLVIPLAIVATWPNGLPVSKLEITLHSPTLRYLDLWGDLHDKILPRPDPAHRSLREQIIHSQSQVPSLRCVRLLATSRLPGLQWKHSTRTSNRNPDWPVICHPAFLDEDSDEVLYYRLPRAVVAQTAFALVPRDRCFSSRILDDDHWPDAYEGDGMTATLWRRWSSSDSEAEEQDEGETRERDDDEDGSGEGGNGGDAEVVHVHGDHDSDTETGDEDLSNELAGEVQLTRDDLLGSFSSSRDTEAYRHVAVWEA